MSIDQNKIFISFSITVNYNTTLYPCSRYLTVQKFINEILLDINIRDYIVCTSNIKADNNINVLSEIEILGGENIDTNNDTINTLVRENTDIETYQSNINSDMFE